MNCYSTLTFGIGGVGGGAEDVSLVEDEEDEDGDEEETGGDEDGEERVEGRRFASLDGGTGKVSLAVDAITAATILGGAVDANHFNRDPLHHRRTLVGQLEGGMGWGWRWTKRMNE